MTITVYITEVADVCLLCSFKEYIGEEGAQQAIAATDDASR